MYSVYPQQCKCMKKLQNNSLYKVGTKYGHFHRFNNFQEMANKLPKVKNLYRISLQTVMQCPLVPTGKDDLSVSD